MSGEGGGEFFVYPCRLHDPAVRYSVPIWHGPIPIVKEELEIAVGSIGPSPALP